MWWKIYQIYNSVNISHQSCKSLSFLNFSSSIEEHTALTDGLYVCMFQPGEVVQMCVPLTVNGDEMHVYKVTLMALVSMTAG